MSSLKKRSANISIQNVGLSFGSTEVLKGVNLEIEPGEFFAFLGPSGSGKSTLLRAIAGFGPTPTGSIKIGGQEVTQLPAWKRNVGMVFQSYALWPHMTVRQNVAFGLEERKVPKNEIEKRVNEALDLVELRHLADRRPSQLSGGQQQRIALARTIVVEPRVLLLDEPLSNLDANLRVQMRRDILDLQQELGLTTIFVTHDQEEANTTSNRIAVLEGGVIQQVGSPVEMYDKPTNHFVASFLGTANIIDGVTKRTSSGVSEFCTDSGLNIPVETELSGKTSLVFRPQAATISEEKNNNKNVYDLSAEIVNSEFLGSIVRYFLDVNGHSVLIDEQHLAGKPIFSMGTNVYLVIPKSQTLVLQG